MRKYWVVAAGLILALTLTSSCTKKSGNVEEGTKNQILHRGNGTEPQGLDPHLVTGVPEHHLIAALFEGLIAEDPKDLSPVPGVAASWKITGGDKVYTFKLQPNAKWSNGEPIKASDFVYSWKRMLTPALAGEYAYMLYQVKNAQAYNKGKIKDFSKVGIKAVNDQTLVVTLRAPTPYFLRLLQHYSTFPVHPATIEKHGRFDDRHNKWTRPGNMVSNGPFLLKEWKVNKVIITTRNPHYWDAATVRLNAIHFYPTDSVQTEERSFRAGELHVTNEAPRHKIAVYQKKQPHLIRIAPYLGSYYYYFNTTKKPFDKVDVRKALSYSIDRKLIVEKVTKGGQIPAYNFTPPGVAGYTSRSAITYDLEKAKKHLAKAGYPGGKGMPTIEILYNTHEAHKSIAEAIQQMWKTNLGVNAVLTNQDWKVYLDTRRNLAYGGVARAGWIGDYPDPNTFLDMLITESGNNDTGWSNKTYDRLIHAAGSTGNHKRRLELFQKAEKLMLEELPIIPIYFYTRIFLISPDVKGWHPNILDHHPYKHVWLSKDEVQLGQN